MSTAEWALHQRTRLSGLRTWEVAGLLAVRADDPALGFLSTVSGIVPGNLPAAIDLVRDWEATLVVSPELAVSEVLAEAGFVRAADRGLAVRGLDDVGAASGVVEAGEDVDGFARVLLAGYEVEGTVAAFVEAEHRLAAVRRFLVLDHDVPIAAAAMTFHDDVAVLGGASTLRAHRGKGAQSRLLRHRLRVAADAGCALAVATAVPGSVSAANLTRAGFTFHLRPAWVHRPDLRLAG
jgi:GNAT superfamily N-acetyltransferase